MNMDIALSNAAITTVPAGATNVVLFDTTANPGTGVTFYRRRNHNRVRRGIVRVYTDQAATFFAQSVAFNSTNWRTYNGSGAGEAITANTFFERDVLFVGDDTRLTITTGTVPTVWEVSVRLVEGDRALGQ
jgi:hypothetical protein